MTDESPDMRSEPEPDAPDSGESIGDESVDELLDRASSLATEMATELGDASLEQRAAHSKESLTDLNDLAESLDKELDQMDDLAKQVGDQIGGAEPEDPTADGAAAPQPKESDPATSPASEAEKSRSESAASLDQSLSEEIDVKADTEASTGDDETADGADAPDFMSDLLEPDGPTTLDAADEASRAAADALDDDLTVPPAEQQPAPAVAQAATGSQPSAAPAKGETPAKQGKLASLLGLASVLTRKPSSVLCTCLDFADRPFSRITPSARAVIGIAALATLATSVGVLVVSML